MTITARSTDGWIQTYTGRAFHLMDPKAEDVFLLDIAHALSMLCRYNGHVRRFYSVAEHSVLMSHAVAPEDALWALLHDATEAYVGDMVRPLKRVMPDYRLVEAGVMDAIVERFDLPGGICPPGVHEADNRILVDERKALLLIPPPLPWGPVEDLEPLGVKIEGWSPSLARDKFLNRFWELTNSRWFQP